MSAFNKCHSLFTGSGLLTMRHLATLQPSVPAPSNRHFVEETASRSSDGISLHLISFRFRSTEDSASLGREKISEPPLILMTIAGMQKSNTISLCPISPLFYCLFSSSITSVLLSFFIKHHPLTHSLPIKVWFCIFYRHVSNQNDKPSIHNTLTIVGGWNSSTI